jgi:hypothetical protein
MVIFGGDITKIRVYDHGDFWWRSLNHGAIYHELYKFGQLMAITICFMVSIGQLDFSFP